MVKARQIVDILDDELNTVARLRSFIGAYKVLSRVIPRCSSYLAPLDAVAAGRPSQESINWIDDLRAAFRSAQNALSSALTITLPRPEDQLWIVTDGAVRDPGIGATLYVMRGDKLCVPGFFSTKLWGCQTTWLPCKVEALSIAAATKHFSPYLIQSVKKACILTDIHKLSGHLVFTETFPTNHVRFEPLCLLRLKLFLLDNSSLFSAVDII